jgi:hypothetical protein
MVLVVATNIGMGITQNDTFGYLMAFAHAVLTKH